MITSHNARLIAFAPIARSDARVLILGSMPGVASLDAHRYYAHPQNKFWPILGAIIGFDASFEYARRVSALLEGRVAVWDVLHACERNGSLDSAIVRQSEVPNNLSDFLERHANIERVCFNGGTAAALFKRHYKEIYRSGKYEFFSLPSTSPAYASITPEQKLVAWEKVLTF
jgi:double-stranded uracil-DNA glycosylase